MATHVMNHFPEKALYKIGDENDLGTHKKKKVKKKWIMDYFLITQIGLYIF